MKITNIQQLKIGDVIYDKEHQGCHIVEIITKSISGYDLLEPAIRLQHYPSNLWYILGVSCNKCGTKTTLKFTATSADKFRCGGQIKVEENIYKCNGKQYTEMYREHTGIKYKNIHYFNDIKNNFYLKD